MTDLPAIPRKTPPPTTSRKKAQEKRSDGLAVAFLKEVSPTRQAAQERRAEEVAAKFQARGDGPSMDLAMDKSVLNVTFAHNRPELANALLLADLGTCDPNFANGFLKQVARIGSKGKEIDQEASNFALSVIRGVAPKDELEAMLALQMAAIHSATMMMATRLNHVGNIPQQDSAERALNKLARTFATQMEALKRYRTGGQQKVIVEHVTVNEGGQAIVGAVTRGGGLE